MIQLTREGVEGAAEIEPLAQQFGREHVFRLRGLLHPNLMQLVSSRLQSCAWGTRDHGTIAREACPVDLVPRAVLNFATNTSAFLDFVRVVTGCPQIARFDGRVYRMSASADHFDSWHSDFGDTQDRLVGMSINLGSEPYEGGVFRLRDEASKEILCDLPNTVPGDAIFFRISPALKHMVTPLVGSVPKTAFAGWFVTGKLDYFGFLKEQFDVPVSAD